MFAPLEHEEDSAQNLVADGDDGALVAAPDDPRVRGVGPGRFRADSESAGDRQAEPLAKYRQQWERLEGREPQRQGI